MEKMNRKERRFYQKKVAPIMDEVVKFSKKMAPKLIHWEVENDEVIGFQEKFPEAPLKDLEKKRVWFERKIKSLNEKHDFINIESDFFMRMIAHYKLELIMQNLYGFEVTNPIFQQTLKQVISKSKSVEFMYFNIHETVNNILIANKQGKFYVKPGKLD